jgi:MinD-like ATPase involved in chromosome partitioning or flagellar assembly
MARVGAVLSSATLALLGSTSERMRELGEADDAITMPLPLSRRLAFVQKGGGVGASTTAAAVASALATRRSGLVLGVNASTGLRALPWQVGVPAGVEPSDRRARARTSGDAVDGLREAPTGLRVLDLADQSAISMPAPASAWFDHVTPISRFYDVVVTDWGVRQWNVDLGDVASSSHVVCLVARSDRQSAEDAAALVPAIGGYPGAPAVVLALVDAGGTGATATHWLREYLGVPIVLIPFDSARSSDQPTASSALATGTRLAYARLAAALVRASQGGGRS